MKSLFFVFLGFFLASPVMARDLSREPTIFSDSNYTQATNQFSTGQTIYYKLTSSGSGDKEKTLRLLNESKGEVSRFALQQSGNGPYVFTVSFPAPNTAGTYYLDVKVDSGSGSVYSSQQNITVGDVSSSNVSSRAESYVNTGGQVQGKQVEITQSTTPTKSKPSPTETIIPTIELSVMPTPTISPELVPSQRQTSILSVIKDWLQGILKIFRFGGT